jgi:hypothetical protein
MTELHQLPEINPFDDDYILISSNQVTSKAKVSNLLALVPPSTSSRLASDVPPENPNRGDWWIETNSEGTPIEEFRFIDDLWISKEKTFTFTFPAKEFPLNPILLDKKYNYLFGGGTVTVQWGLYNAPNEKYNYELIYVEQTQNNTSGTSTTSMAYFADFHPTFVAAQQRIITHIPHPKFHKRVFTDYFFYK